MRTKSEGTVQENKQHKNLNRESVNLSLPT